MSWGVQVGGIVGAFLGFVVLIILHEAGHFAAAKAVGMRVERFYLFFGRTPLRFRRGETEYGIGWIPAGGYVKISGMNPSEELPEGVRDRAYHAQPVWKRIVVIAAGPAVNVVLALVLLVVFFAAIGTPSRVTNEVDEVQKGFPAEGRVFPGDRVVAVDGRRGPPEELSRIIATHRCAAPVRPGCTAERPAELLIERGRERVRVEVKPVYDTKEQPPRMLVGFRRRALDREPLPLTGAVTQSLDTAWFITARTAELPQRLFNAEQRKEISGIVGGYEVTRRTIIDEVGDVVFILAAISLSLALINLFPFLPLDGGHIFWTIVEKVRGRPVPLRVMERSGALGFVLVMIIFMIGFTNDIGRITSGEGFGVR